MIRTLILTASLALVAPAAMLAQSHPQNHPQGRPHGQAGHEPIDPKLHAALHAMTGSWHGSTHAADGASKKFNLTLATDKAGQVTLKTATDLPIRLGAAKAIALEGNTLRWTQEVSGAPCNATAVVKAATAQTADTMDGRLVCASGEIAFSVQKSKG